LKRCRLNLRRTELNFCHRSGDLRLFSTAGAAWSEFLAAYAIRPGANKQTQPCDCLKAERSARLHKELSEQTDKRYRIPITTRMLPLVPTGL
jgi:hypothetical protein